MAGTVAGAAKAVASTKERHGEDFYKRTGQIGGKHKGPKGFALNRELARTAGAKGGRISKRKKGTTSEQI